MDDFSETVVVTTRPEPKHASKPRRQKQPRYSVMLWDSDAHTFDYVIRMLQELFGHCVESAFQMAANVDAAGKAAVFTTAREHAEFKRDQILAYGKDALCSECKGSMHATVEPAPGE